MSDLTSALNKSEINLLLEAVGDWESIGNHEYYVLNIVKNQPMPDESDDNYEFTKSLKEFFKRREKEIQDNRTLRQEQAILVKAKLVLIRQDLGIRQLFNNDNQLSASVKELQQIAQKSTPKELTPTTSAEKEQLELAEFYIKDLGVWDMYQKFLEERKFNQNIKQSTSEQHQDE